MEQGLNILCFISFAVFDIGLVCLMYRDCSFYDKLKRLGRNLILSSAGVVVVALIIQNKIL